MSSSKKPSKARVISKKHRDAVLSLIAIYRSASLAVLKGLCIDAYPRKTWGWGAAKANKLSGYGSTETCHLCLSVDAVCGKCIYGKKSGCKRNKESVNTWNLIENSRTYAKLISALNSRADYLETLLASVLVNDSADCDSEACECGLCK